jgi:hypothetical protein
MKALSVLLLIALAAGCNANPQNDVAGQYLSDNGLIVEKLDLANCGTAMHEVSVDFPDREAVNLLIDMIQLGGAKWSQEEGKIKVVGFSNESKQKGREVVYIFEIQPNGDLVRHNGQGEFVRFKKQ